MSIVTMLNMKQNCKECAEGNTLFIAYNFYAIFNLYGTFININS